MMIAALLPAMAGTSISSPSNGSAVGSTFNLIMSADSCSSRPVIAVGYSLDNNTSTPIFFGQTMNGPVSAASGWHTVHVKVWSDWGAVCVSDVSVNVGAGTQVTNGGSNALSVVPGNAVKISNIHTLDNWIQIHDGGTPGSSSGWTGTQASPSMTGAAREFATSFSYFGGQRYSALIDSDTSSTNFLYDTWVYIAGNADGFSNLEFDLNQTMPNGQTALMGFQCDSWIGRWDYTINAGSPNAPIDTWQHSYAPCNVHNWGANQWHHVQIWFAHDYNGWVTYHTVWLDGVQQDLNVTTFSGFSLGWAPAIVTNFQIDGASPGNSSSQVYLDGMTVYRW